MKDSVLRISKQSGDAHIGQTLVRLAGLAAANHRYEQASLLMLQQRGRNEEHHTDDRKPMVHQARTDAGAPHKEVGR